MSRARPDSGKGLNPRSPAAMEKSWFSRKIWTKRSNVFPTTLLVGLRVRAVAAACAMELAAVAVYIVSGPTVVDWLLPILG